MTTDGDSRTAGETEPRTYYKKPVAVEAMRYDGTNAAAVVAWAAMYPARYGASSLNMRRSATEIVVYTLEGVMYASPGDWMVKGVRGEFYPVKDAVFKASYEERGDSRTAGETKKAL